MGKYDCCSLIAALISLIILVAILSHYNYEKEANRLKAGIAPNKDIVWKFIPKDDSNDRPYCIKDIQD